MASWGWLAIDHFGLILVGVGCWRLVLVGVGWCWLVAVGVGCVRLRHGLAAARLVCQALAGSGDDSVTHLVVLLRLGRFVPDPLQEAPVDLEEAAVGGVALQDADGYMMGGRI